VRYKVGDIAQAKKCSNPECDAEPATGRVAEPVGDNWFFNCSQCGFGYLILQVMQKLYNKYGVGMTNFLV